MVTDGHLFFQFSSLLTRCFLSVSSWLLWFQNRNVASCPLQMTFCLLPSPSYDQTDPIWNLMCWICRFSSSTLIWLLYQTSCSDLFPSVLCSSNLPWSLTAAFMLCRAGYRAVSLDCFLLGFLQDQDPPFFNYQGGFNVLATESFVNHLQAEVSFFSQ